MHEKFKKGYCLEHGKLAESMEIAETRHARKLIILKRNNS